MNLWVIAKGYAPDEGGMQTYGRGVAQGYAALGHDVTVFTQTSIGPRATHDGKVSLIDIGPGHGVSVPLRFLKAMRAHGKAHGSPGFVHATTWRTGVLPMLRGLPYAVTVHGREIMYPTGLAQRIMRRVLRRASHIIAVSQTTANAARLRCAGLCPPIAIAWNGTSDGMYRQVGKPEQPPLILSLCRLEPRKNIATAIQAAGRCAARGMDFRYLICGRGPELESIRHMVRSLGLTGCITVTGFVPEAEAQRLYAAADIFLHPQVAADDGKDFEGFGIAIADAMIAGAACVVGSAGGPAELVRNGETGLIVDGRDVDAVTAALERLLHNAAERQAMGNAAADWAEHHFTWAAHCAKALESHPHQS